MLLIGTSPAVESTKGEENRVDNQYNTEVMYGQIRFIISLSVSLPLSHTHTHTKIQSTHTHKINRVDNKYNTKQPGSFVRNLLSGESY